MCRLCAGALAVDGFQGLRMAGPLDSRRRSLSASVSSIVPCSYHPRLGSLLVSGFWVVELALRGLCYAEALVSSQEAMGAARLDVGEGASCALPAPRPSNCSTSSPAPRAKALQQSMGHFLLLRLLISLIRVQVQSAAPASETRRRLPVSACLGAEMCHFPGSAASARCCQEDTALVLTSSEPHPWSHSPRRGGKGHAHMTEC